MKTPEMASQSIMNKGNSKKEILYREMEPRHKRIFEDAKIKLVAKLGFGMRDFDTLDQDVIDVLNQRFLENEEFKMTLVEKWEEGLQNINIDVREVEDRFASHFAEVMFKFLTTESRLKNELNNQNV